MYHELRRLTVAPASNVVPAQTDFAYSCRDRLVMETKPVPARREAWVGDDPPVRPEIFPRGRHKFNATSPKSCGDSRVPRTHDGVTQAVGLLLWSGREGWQARFFPCGPLPATLGFSCAIFCGSDARMTHAAGGSPQGCRWRAGPMIERLAAETSASALPARPTRDSDTDGSEVFDPDGPKQIELTRRSSGRNASGYGRSGRDRNSKATLVAISGLLSTELVPRQLPAWPRGRVSPRRTHRTRRTRREERCAPEVVVQVVV